MRREHIIQVNDKEYILGRRTWIMGILNVTPDSFSDGGRYFDKEQAVAHGLELIAEGADIVDVGGESTRPGSDFISAEEEMQRIIPVISSLRKHSDVLISVDTTKSAVGRAALDAGADILNDISAFRLDPDMLTLAARAQAPVILMHMKGLPKTMQVDPHYDALLPEVRDFLEDRIGIATSGGVVKNNIIIDPGIGFGKRQEDNLSLIKNLSYFDDLGQPILIGVSRKSFIGRILDLPEDDRIEGTIASALMSVIYGADILRVHDVAAVKRALRVAEAIMDSRFYCRDMSRKGGKEPSYA